MIHSDNLIPLIGGAYQARAAIADYSVCENLFPEINPDDQNTPTQVTHYPREGERPLSSPPNIGPGRGVFRLSNGNLFAVVGPNVYYIDTAWNFNQIGQIAGLQTPVSISDNGTQAVLVDGTPSGYTITLADNTFAQLIDPTGTFQGSRRTDFCDTFLAFAQPGTNKWTVSNPNQTTFNVLVQAAKDSNPDPIQTLAFNIRQPWLIGTESSEVWFNAGSTPFPYQEWPNIFIPYGSAAPYSLAQADVDLFWLSRNPQGQAIAVKTEGYRVLAISTRALEYEWSKYQTISDCITGTFQQAGHTFIVFHFPTANKSWGYDLATKQWHRRFSIDQNGAQKRENATFYASVGDDGGYQKTVVGQDWATGQLYALDPEYYTDNAMPIVCRRTFPHILKDMRMITATSFIADFETGDTPNTTEGFNTAWGSALGTYAGVPSPGAPALCMRYSNTGGSAWGTYRQKTLISSGNYRSLMRWRGLGMARDRVYELLWSFPGKTALQGAYLEAFEHGA